MKQGEKMKLPKIKYNDKGLVPVIVQDYKDNKVLMLAYMNKESLKRTLKKKLTCFWSRSRKTFWIKGETSGHFQKIKSIHTDCDRDTILVNVEQVGGIACHTGNRSCFFRKIKI